MTRSVIFILLLAAAPVLVADVLIVASRGSSVVTLIDPESMTVLATVGVGSDPHEVAVSRDGTRAYVTNYGGSFGSSLSIIDVVAKTRIKDVSILPLRGPHGIVERNGKIWFTAERSNAVGRYDPVTDTVDWTGATGQPASHMLAVRADGSEVITANISAGTASLIPVGDGATSSARKTIITVAGGEGIAISPHDHEVWVGSVANDGVSVIDLRSETATRILPGTFGYRLTFSGDGRTLYIPRANQGTVAVIDAIGRQELRSISIGGAPFSVVLAQNDSIAFVAADAPPRVLKVDLQTDTVVGSVSVPPVPDGMAYADLTEEPRIRRRRARS